MKEHSDPIEFVIEFALNNGASSFIINNAKDQLKKLKQKLADSYQELFNCNQDLIEETKQSINYKVVAWARTNDRGDLFDLRLQKNPYLDDETVVPLYRIYDGNNT